MIRLPLSFMLAMAALALAMSSRGIAQTNGPAPPALHATGPEFGPGTHHRADVVRHRTVVIDLDLLATLEPDTRDRFALNLFADTQLTAEIDRKSRPGARVGFPGSYALSGNILEHEGGTIDVVVHGDVVAAVITLPGQTTYQLHGLGAGRHEVCELDFSGHPGCGVTDDDHLDQAVLQTRKAAASSGVAASAADDGTVLDMMIVYSDDARAYWGNTGNMATDTAITQAEVMLSISVSNSAYIASQINSQMNLVHMSEVAYTESGSSSTDLNRLTNIDGILDDLHTTRDLVSADNVGLFLSPFDVCGRAWIMGSNSPTFEQFSFNVSAIGCAAQNRTYPHEVGHNQGCSHQRGGGTPGVFTYSYGYSDPADAFRTVMSISGGPRVGHFSNPNVFYMGDVTGIADTEPDSADNAKSINITRVTMAQFRIPNCPGGEPTVDCNFNCIEDADDILAGTEPDCDNNLIPDVCDISAGTIDCDNNGVPDVCEDCNNNGTGDACEFDSTFMDVSPLKTPFGAAFPVEDLNHTIVSPPTPLGDVTFTFSAVGTLASTSNHVRFSLNGVLIEENLFTMGSDCPGTPDVDEYVMPAATFLAHTGGGNAEIFLTTFDYFAMDCGGATSISVTTSYPASNGTADTNNNGLPDECDLARGDSDLDGKVGINDFLAVLSTWGVCADPCPEDSNLDGIVGVVDFLLILANWDANIE